MSKRSLIVVIAGFGLGGAIFIQAAAQPQPQLVNGPTIDVTDCAVRILASFTGNSDRLAEVDLIGAHKETKGFDPQLAKTQMANEAIRWCLALQEALATGGPADDAP